MRKILISAALGTAALVAGPASAQYGDYGRYGYGYNRGAERQIEQQLERVHDRIDRAADQGRLSRREVFRLQREYDQIDRLFDRYRRNGLSGGEYQDLQRRIDNLRQRLRYERQDDRYDRW